MGAILTPIARVVAHLKRNAAPAFRRAQKAREEHDEFSSTLPSANAATACSGVRSRRDSRSPDKFQRRGRVVAGPALHGPPSVPSGVTPGSSQSTKARARVSASAASASRCQPFRRPALPCRALSPAATALFTPARMQQAIKKAADSSAALVLTGELGQREPCSRRDSQPKIYSRAHRTHRFSQRCASTRQKAAALKCRLSSSRCVRSHTPRPLQTSSPHCRAGPARSSPRCTAATWRSKECRSTTSSSNARARRRRTHR